MTIALDDRQDGVLSVICITSGMKPKLAEDPSTSSKYWRQDARSGVEAEEENAEANPHCNMGAKPDTSTVNAHHKAKHDGVRAI